MVLAVALQPLPQTNILKVNNMNTAESKIRKKRTMLLVGIIILVADCALCITKKFHIDVNIIVGFFVGIYFIWQGYRKNKV